MTAVDEPGTPRAADEAHAVTESKVAELADVVLRLRKTRERLLEAMEACMEEAGHHPKSGALRREAEKLAIEAHHIEVQERIISESLSQLRGGAGVTQAYFDRPLTRRDPLARTNFIFPYGATDALLSGLGWTAVPQALFQFTSLTYIDLSSNGLTAFPAELAQISNLERLDISRNPLGSLPAALSKLTYLTRFIADNCQLAELEAGWSHGFARLVVLSLASNRLTEGSFGGTELATAMSLRSLDLRGNQLTTVPVTLCRSCRELRKLYLDDNQLEALPEELGGLAKMRYISLNNNRLTALPRAVAQLPNLLGLALAHNQFATQPELRGNLHVVRLEGNPFNATSN